MLRSAATLYFLGALLLASCGPASPTDGRPADSDAADLADAGESTDGSTDGTTDEYDAPSDADQDPGNADADAGDDGDADPDTGDDTSEDAEDALTDTELTDTELTDTELTDTEPDAGPTEDVDTGPAPLFDMALIADESTIDCRFDNHRTVMRGLRRFDAWDVSFVSYEVNEGVLTPIRMRGFAARPADAATPLPGVANVHGLGGHATVAMATGPAELLGYFVIAATGPGGGSEDPATQSEGRPSSHADGYRIFDVATDPRGSWLWAHAVAAMRALTCLGTHPDVDDTRLGITGFSGGGIASLIAASVDGRVGAAVPLSGTGGWPESAAAAQSWFHALLTPASLDTASDEWRIITSTIDPAVLVPHARAPIFLVNGSTDEFFPLVSHLRTYEAIAPDTARRTSIAANFDHGCYEATGGESGDAIAERAALRATGAQRAWFHHHFGTDPTYAYLPDSPTVTVADVGGLTMVTIAADPGGDALEIESAHLWASIDSAATFASAEIDATDADGVFAELLAVPYNPDAIWFADVVYRTRGFVGTERFSLSTTPRIPPGHVPAVRGITTCLP